MDVREFLYMLRELDIIDRRNLTIKAAIKIVIATMANLGTIQRRNDGGSGNGGQGGSGDLVGAASTAGAGTRSSVRTSGRDSGADGDRADGADGVVHQGDLLSFANFVTALGRCYEVKTYDGIVPLDKRLSSCFVGDLFQKVRSRTDIAALWL